MKYETSFKIVGIGPRDQINLKSDLRIIIEEFTRKIIFLNIHDVNVQCMFLLSSEREGKITICTSSPIDTVLIDNIENYITFELNREKPDHYNGIFRFIIDRFTLKNQYGISDALAIQGTHRRKLTLLENLNIDGEISFLLFQNHLSLTEDSNKTKFFHAFLIIEWLENKFSHLFTDHSELIFSSEQVNSVVQHIEDNIPIDEQIRQRTIERIKREISKITFKSRRDKLLYVLNNKLRIEQVSWVGTTILVNDNFIKTLIETRNGIAHASSDLTVLEKAVWQLILVNQIIIKKRIENTF